MDVLSYEKLNAELKKLALQHPTFTRLFLEGYSEEKRKIYSISVGKGKRVLICTAGVHARENINPSVLVKIAKYYCAKEYCKKNYCDLLQNYRILFIPLVNPDGYEMVRNQQDKAEWKYNARGIDINRDFLCKAYRAQVSSPAPFSAVESRVLANIFKREKSVGYIDFHSRGREIYWYRAALDEKYNFTQRKVAEELCLNSGYRLGDKEDEMKDSLSGGNTVQYYSEQYHLPAITVETVGEEAQFPLEDYWVKTTFEEIKELPMRYLEYIQG